MKCLDPDTKNILVKHIVDWLFASPEDIREAAKRKGVYELFTEEFYNIADKILKEGYVICTEEWKGDSC